MREQISRRLPFARYGAALLVISLGVVTLLGSSGNSGGFSAGGTNNATFQANYALNAAGVSDGTSTGISMTYTDNAGAHALLVNPNATNGNGLYAAVLCDSSTQACSMTSLKAGTTIDITDTNASLDYTIKADSNVSLDAEEIPTSGTMRVVDHASSKTITMTFTNCGNVTGVQLNDTNGNTDLGCYVWKDFLDLVNSSTTNTDQYMALLSYQALNNLLETVEFAISTFTKIDDSVAQSGGSINTMCDAFSDVGLTAPITVMADPGQSTFTWTDDNPDGNVGSGDSFRLDYTDCWQNNSEDTQHELLGGGVNLVSYNYTTNANNELTNIGFYDTTAGKTGGIFYDAFKLQVTSSDANKNATIVSTLDLNGGMSFKLVAL